MTDLTTQEGNWRRIGAHVRAASNENAYVKADPERVTEAYRDAWLRVLPSGTRGMLTRYVYATRLDPDTAASVYADYATRTGKRVPETLPELTWKVVSVFTVTRDTAEGPRILEVEGWQALPGFTLSGHWPTTDEGAHQAMSDFDPPTDQVWRDLTEADDVPADCRLPDEAADTRQAA